MNDSDSETITTDETPPSSSSTTTHQDVSDTKPVPTTTENDGFNKNPDTTTKHLHPDVTDIVKAKELSVLDFASIGLAILALTLLVFLVVIISLLRYKFYKRRAGEKHSQEMM